MSEVVIGTAGHIDHGKSSLIKALSGIDPDRLKEEKARGLTIELGFAKLKLPSGKVVSLIDVPGHERFIKNMLAGATGIDLALLVIAADEGVMPQTREHFAILELLEIQKIIVVITKTDLVDPDILSLVKAEAESILQDTVYRDAPILTFSTISGEGKTELLHLLDQTVTTFALAKKCAGVPRLPIDRVFTIQGFGTVVTGTLLSGEILLGQQLYIPLKNKPVRVRNLQVHNRAVAKAEAGQRVAVNLAGIEYGEAERGDVLTEEGWFIPTQRIDVKFRFLEEAAFPLKKLSRIRFHQGTLERMGRVVLLDREEVLPGEEVYLQLMLEKPVVVQKNDKFILRSYSPVQTIGGGIIIEPLAGKYRQKELAQAMQEIILKEQGTPEETLLFQLEKAKTVRYLKELVRVTEYPADTVEKIMGMLVQQGQVLTLALNDREILFLSRVLLAEWEGKLRTELEKLLRKKPLAPGVNKEELHSLVFPQLNQKEYNAFVKYWVKQEKITLTDGLYLLPKGYNPAPQGQWLEVLREIEAFYQRHHWQIPEWKTVTKELAIDEQSGGQVLSYLLRKGKLIQLAADLYVLAEILPEGQEKIKAWLEEHDGLTVAQARDLLETTRKIAVPFLEYLDKIKFTRREGDLRKLAV